jgi:hypothetical protein
VLILAGSAGYYFVIYIPKYNAEKLEHQNNERPCRTRKIKRPLTKIA